MSNQRTSRLLGGFAAVAVLVSAACHVTPRGNSNIYTGTEGSHEVGRLEGNTDLANRLAIQNPRSRRLEDGRLQVQFDLQNTRSTQTECAWAVDWFDGSGFQVAQATRHFEPLSLGGGAVVTLNITGPTPEATSWRL